MENNILAVKNIKKTFRTSGGIFAAGRSIYAVNNVSFEIGEGRTRGLVGESGCGKTTVGKIILGLEKPDSGEVSFNGKKISGLAEKELRPVRKDLHIIFQDPFASLNPRIRVGNAIGEALKIAGAADTSSRVKDIIKEVGLPEDTYYRYPHEFSGGQRQRICIARAIVSRPKFVVCDEPVSSLDVSVQSQIINLLKDLKDEFRLTYLFISHDLRVVKNICDSISVMYYGNIVEEGESEDIFAEPRHPYTRLLISSVPSIATPAAGARNRAAEAGKKEKSAPGRALHRNSEIEKGCAFYSRCLLRQNRCAGNIPELRDTGRGHKAACFLQEK